MATLASEVGVGCRLGSIAPMSEEPYSAPVYAGFWRRVIAATVDGAVLLAGLLGLGYALGAPVGLLLQDRWDANLLSGLLGLAYGAGFESSGLQATPGKLLIGIKVTDLRGERIGFGRALVRNLAQFASAAFLMLGYVMAAFTLRRQCLHDKIAGTLVVRRELAPQQIAQAPPAAAWSRWSIAAVVAPLLVAWSVLWLAGVDRGHPPRGAGTYAARTEVAASLYYASDAIDLAENMYAENSDFTQVNIAAVDLSAEAARTIAALQVVAGTIRITYGGEADRALQGHTVTLTPALDGSGNIAWICGYAEVPDGYDIVNVDYRSLTDVAAAALPPDCLPDGSATETSAPASGLTA